MKMKIRVKILSLILSTTMIFNTTMPILASEQISDEIKEIAMYLGQVLQVIDDKYVNEVDKNKLMAGAIQGAVESLSDEHSTYLSEEELNVLMDNLENKKEYIGIDFKVNNDNELIVKNVLKKSPADNAGILKEDIILAINEIPLNPYNMYMLIHQEFEKNDVLTFTIKRNNINIKLKVRPIIKQFEDVIYKNLENNVSYIKITSIDEGTYNKFKAILDSIENLETENLILDLRDNTGGYIDEAINIAKEIVPSGNIITLKARGKIVQDYKSTTTNTPFKKVAVLTNGMTASSAEILTSALQESKKAKIFGSKTYGKGSVQEIMFLSKNDFLKLTVNEIFTRDGNKLNKVGITPNEVINMPNLVHNQINIDDKNLKDALEFLNFDVSNEFKIWEAIKIIKSKNNLSNNYVLDDKIIDAINNELYTAIDKEDIVFNIAYKYINSNK